MEALEKGQEFPYPECPFWIILAKNGDAAFRATKKFAENYPNSFIVFDSIDAAQPETVSSREIGDSKVGDFAKLMSDAMRKLVNLFAQQKTTAIFINQIRDSVSLYSAPHTTPGGHALRFYARQRIRLSKPPAKDYTIKNDAGDIVGYNVRYKIIKNTFAPDGQEGMYSVIIDNGIFREQETLKSCLEYGILSLGGRGGRQVLLPILEGDKPLNECETVFMKQSKAAFRLMIDQELHGRLRDEIDQLTEQNTNVVQNMLDQIVSEG
jgi:hypothetical protein